MDASGDSSRSLHVGMLILKDGGTGAWGGLLLRETVRGQHTGNSGAGEV